MSATQVFVSHASDMALYPEGRSFVQAALDAIGRTNLASVDMRYFAARDGLPADYCRQRVRECDIYVLLVGFRYGTRVPGETFSYIELEFMEATAAGMPRFVFLLDESHPLPRKFVDPDTSAVNDFRQRLRDSDLIVPTFDSADGLDLRVYQAMVQHRGLAPPTQTTAEDLLPAVWNAPGRNVTFAGRNELIGLIRQRLHIGGRAAPQALYGISGVGKTSLAVEYAHRYAEEYRSVWWIDAERPDLIGEQLARWAVAAGLAAPESDTPSAVASLRLWARRHSGWLAVFDNASGADTVRDWLLDGPGHTLITSKSPAWAEIAQSAEVPLLPRNDSVTVLGSFGRSIDKREAHDLAEALGDLPLALSQAASLMATTGMSVAEYLHEFRQDAAHLLSAGRSFRYPDSLAAAVRMSVRNVQEEDAAGALILQVCAHLASTPVPHTYFMKAKSSFPATLAYTLVSRLSVGECAAQLAARGLLRVNAQSLEMHRLVQLVVVDGLSLEARNEARKLAEALLVAAAPGPDEWRNPELGPAWALLLPHLLTVVPESISTDVRIVACRAVWYLFERSDVSTAAALALEWYETWGERFGLDDGDTLAAASLLARARRRLGDYTAARQLDDDTYTRRTRLLGAEHPDTLLSAHNLGFDLYLLGQFSEARRLDEEVLARRRNALGDHHPNTLRSANNLGLDLYALGNFADARALHEVTYERFRAVLGDDHPDTLYACTNLARDITALGDPRLGREMNERTLSRYLQVMGEDHPYTLDVLSNLARDSFALGEFHDARALDEKVLTARQRVLGDEHPATLASARSLSRDLEELGENLGADGRRDAERIVTQFLARLHQDPVSTPPSSDQMGSDFGSKVKPRGSEVSD